MSSPVPDDSGIIHVRDTRLDVLRALALLCIFIDHVSGTVYEEFTYKNFGFSDATEVFVLISGTVCGIVYGSRFYKKEWFSTLKIWRRSFVLYSAHILVTGIILAFFCILSRFIELPELLSRINMASFFDDPARVSVGLISLGHQFGYCNILPLYIVLMLMAPFMLYLAVKNIKLLLVLSCALYLASGFYHLHLPNYPMYGEWFLNPLSWQFLFAIGLSSAVYIRKGNRISFYPVLFAVAIGYLVLSFVWVRCHLWWIDTTMGLPYARELTGFDKTYLSLPRLLHILSWGYVFTVVPALANIARTSLSHPLAVFGRNSLPVFVSGTVISMTGLILKYINPGNFFYDTLFLSVGIAIQFSVAYFRDGFRAQFSSQKFKG